MKRVLYFGLFDPQFSRNKVYIDGLRQNGCEVIICTDTAPGMRKYWNLFWKHWRVRAQYDVMIVGYPGYIIVPFAKLITRKRVVLDALCSFYESAILSRDAHQGMPFRVTYTHLIDWFATRSADVILVETDKQREYFIHTLGVPTTKCMTVYTGVDDTVFYPDPQAERYEKFTVLFRGRITHEAGVETVLRAAKLLEHEPIEVLIIGYGWNTEMQQFTKTFQDLHLTNVRHVSQHLPFEELVPLMHKCHVSLGQFADHERLQRTVPHKAYESLSMGLPYITARTDGIKEILKDGETCLMVNPADPRDLAAKIVRVYKDPVLMRSLAESGRQLYEERFSPKKIVRPLLDVIQAASS